MSQIGVKLPNGLSITLTRVKLQNLFIYQLDWGQIKIIIKSVKFQNIKFVNKFIENKNLDKIYTSL
jgi:hypothetical protein